MVGTMPLRSSLWIAAADTSERSASCWRDRPFCWRSSRIFGPRPPMIRPSSSSTVRWGGGGARAEDGSAAAARARFDRSFICLVCLLRCTCGRHAGSTLTHRTTELYKRRAVHYRKSKNHIGGSFVPARVVVVGGGAAGIGAAGAARRVDPSATVTVFTEYEDVAYSPCGIPYVHGKEIPTFEQLF